MLDSALSLPATSYHELLYNDYPQLTEAFPHAESWEHIKSWIGMQGNHIYPAPVSWDDPATVIASFHRHLESGQRLLDPPFLAAHLAHLLTWGHWDNELFLNEHLAERGKAALCFKSIDKAAFHLHADMLLEPWCESVPDIANRLDVRVKPLQYLIEKIGKPKAFPCRHAYTTAAWKKQCREHAYNTAADAVTCDNHLDDVYSKAQLSDPQTWRAIFSQRPELHEEYRQHAKEAYRHGVSEAYRHGPEYELQQHHEPFASPLAMRHFVYSFFMSMAVVPSSFDVEGYIVTRFCEMYLLEIMARAGLSPHLPQATMDEIYDFATNYPHVIAEQWMNLENKSPESVEMYLAQCLASNAALIEDEDFILNVLAYTYSQHPKELLVQR